MSMADNPHSERASPGCLLTLDTCFDACSVALTDPNLQAFRHCLIGQGHAELLAPMIAAVLADCNQSANMLTGIVVSHGPGSFTGVRIGLATARTLALPFKIPVHAISTLELMAWVASQSVTGRAADWIAVLHDARRGEVYSQLFTSTVTPLAAAATVKRADLHAWLPPGRGCFIGTARNFMAESLLETHPQCPWVGGIGRPTALWLARCVNARYPKWVRMAITPDHTNAANAVAPHPLPLYLRAPDAVLPTG